MKKITLVIFSLIYFQSFSQNFQWAKHFGSTNWDEAGSIALDSNGNLYNAGYFQGTVDFDPGPGVFSITALGAQDIFISKWDTAGNFIWVKTIASPGWEDCNAITTDNKGNIYAVGFFLGTTDFDPSTGVFNLTSSSGGDGFICKLDQNGNFKWAKQLKGTQSITIYDIAIDKKGNILTTGYFDGKADMDPGPGTYTLQVLAYSDMFVNKLDSSGNFVWARQCSGMDGEVGHSICSDGNSNIYTTGTFFGAVDFDPGPGTYTLQAPAMKTEIFIHKLDSSGNFAWAKKMGGENGLAIVADVAGNVYETGMNFGNDIVINKLSPSGTLVWSKQIGGAMGFSLLVDKNFNAYNTGTFFGTKDFDPGPGVYTLTAVSTDSYIEKLDALGNLVWVKQFTSSKEAQARESVMDANNNIYTTGFFNGTTDFDPSPATYTLTSNGDYDNFIHKLTSPLPNTTAVSESAFTDAHRIFPNPTEGVLNISTLHDPVTLRFSIRNSMGLQVQTQTIIENNQTKIEIREPNGLYFLEILYADGSRSYSKFIKK